MVRHWKVGLAGLATAVLLASPLPVHAQRCVAQGDGTTWGDCNSGGGGGGGGGGALSGGLNALIDILSHPGPVTDPTTQAALDAYKRGNYAAALSYARTVLARAPNDYVGLLIYHTSLGIQAFNARNYAQTIRHMHIVIAQMQGRGVAAYGPRGLLLSSQAHIAAGKGNWADAARLYYAAVRISPGRTVDKANYEYALAGVAVERSDFSQARAHLKRVLKIWPDFPAAKQLLAKLSAFENSKRASAAIAKSRKAEVQGQTEKQQQKEQASTAYEQAKEAKSHSEQGSKQAQGVNDNFTSNQAAERAKEQASIPFDNSDDHRGGAVIHFQKSTSTPPPPLLSGVSDDQLKKTLNSTTQGRALLDNLTTTENELQRTKAKIEMLRSTPNAAANPAYSKALVAQDQLLQKLAPLQKQAQKIVTKVVLDGPKNAATPKRGIDHIAVPSPDTDDAKSGSSN